MKKTILFLTFVLIALVSCKQNYISEEEATTSTIKSVGIQSIATMKTNEPVLATGRVASKEEITLSFKTGGIVRSLSADEGERASKGKSLARLDLQEINAQVASAKFNYEKSTRDTERARLLYQDTVGTLENYQNAQTRQQLAKSQYDIAQFNRQYSTITMPLSGTILERYVEEGELVTPGQPIYKIGSSTKNSGKIIRLGLADKDVVKLKIGDEGTVVFDAFAKAEYSITVSQIAENANAQTGLFEVEVTLENTENPIKNGFIGNVAIYPSTASSGIKIPINALVEGSDRNALIYYTTDQKTVSSKTVNILEIRKDYFLIAEDNLPNNAAVVVKGAAFLRDKDSINVLKK